MADISIEAGENIELSTTEETNVEETTEQNTEEAVEVDAANDNGIGAELLAETEETTETGESSDVKEDAKDEEEMLAGGDEKTEEQEVPVDLGEEDAGDGEEEEEEDDDDEEEKQNEEKQDPNVMPQVNVAVLAKRKWQVKVFPLKPADFTSGQISKVFKSARESLLYLMTGQYSRGKGEMYIQNYSECMKVVQGLMSLDSHFPEINIEIVYKNSDGAIKEKAAMRFDTKMVRMLFVGPPGAFKNNRGQGGRLYGRKRERLIGSVFVKNLPPGTTKNMLRVMFPFAQEINYNPEKYTEGTARLVLRTRSTVVPCLKAFAKVELGGNILELHPLEKQAHMYEKNAPKKRHTSESKPRSSSKSKDIKSDESDSPENKSSEDSKIKKDDDPSANSESKDKESNESSKKEHEKKSGDKKPGEKRSGPGGPQRNRQGGRKFNNKDKDSNSRKSFGDNRAGQRNNSNRFNSGRSNARSQGFANSRSFSGSDLRKGTRGGRGGALNRRQNISLGATTELVQKAEATKDMMILQNQLNMAIKSQLAVLNQTQRAVAEAKRGASNLGLGSSSLGLSGAAALGSRSSLSQLSETRRETVGYPKTNRQRERALEQSAWGSYGKRSAAQADLEDDYSMDDFSNKRNGAQRLAGQPRQQARNKNRNRARALQNQQRRALADERLRTSTLNEDVYRQTQTASYGVRERLEDSYDNYGSSARNYSAVNLDAAQSLYDNDNYGYRY